MKNSERLELKKQPYLFLGSQRLTIYAQRYTNCPEDDSPQTAFQVTGPVRGTQAEAEEDRELVLQLAEKIIAMFHLPLEQTITPRFNGGCVAPSYPEFRVRVSVKQVNGAILSRYSDEAFPWATIRVPLDYVFNHCPWDLELKVQAALSACCGKKMKRKKQ